MVRPTTKAGQYFGLLLNELRMCGYDIHLSDKATAKLLFDGMCVLDPLDDDAAITADNLSFAFEHLADLSVDDNGSNPE